MYRVIFCLLASVTAMTSQAMQSTVPRSEENNRKSGMRVFRIDMSKGVLLDKLEAETSEMIQFQLLNINPFLFRLAVEGKAISYNISLPESIKRFPFPTKLTSPPQNGNVGADEDPKISRFRKAHEDFVLAFTKFLNSRITLIDRMKQEFPDENKTKHAILLEFTSTPPEGIQDVTPSLKNADLFIDEVKGKFSEVQAAYNHLPPAQQTIFKSEYEKIAITGKVNTDQFIDSTKTLLHLVIETPYIFYSLAEQAKGDEMHFMIRGESKENPFVEAWQIEKFERSYSVEVAGGVKWDVSTGFALTSLTDESFTTRDGTVTIHDPNTNRDTTRQGKIILQDSDDDARFGFLVLLNFHQRISGDVNAGISVGIAVTLEQKQQYLLGWSLLLGKQQRLVLTFGPAFGAVTRLAPGLERGGILESNLSTVPTQEISRFGGFFSLTYNIP